MAIRLRRKLNGGWWALCAANSKSQDGDVYIDDAQDHAIREKLIVDWKSEGFMFDPRKKTCQS